MQALEQVFDTNHDGQLNASDAAAIASNVLRFLPRPLPGVESHLRRAA
jgi:hypothetical protein